MHIHKVTSYKLQVTTEVESTPTKHRHIITSSHRHIITSSHRHIIQQPTAP